MTKQRESAPPAPPENVDRRRVGEQTKARIDAAAVDLFFERGYRRTTMREIATACELTPAAFYNHYTSKDDLLLEVILTAFASLDSALTKALQEADPAAKSQVIAFARTMTIWHCTHIRLARVSARETQELPDKYADTVRASLTSLRVRLETIINDGVSKGEFTLPGPVDTTAPIAVSTVLGLVRSIPSWQFEKQSGSPEEMGDIIAALIVRMFEAS
ncbi:transcriptional regulator, TetR family [Mycolicibacterium rhodesiae JS60]|nr:transcriptional regulator, TetR family [Mycolicibacterium rhodesiae JS60]